MSRYIDAYEVKRQIQKATEGQNDVMKVFLNAMYSIDKIPTADVRENVRGEWVQHTIGGNVWSIDKDTCSVCKETFYQISETGCVWNFCPNCGADMRPISALSENVEIVSNLKRGESCAEKWRNTLKKIKYFKKDKAEEDNNERN